MAHKVKVSLILPLYNSEIFIDECLEAVESQTFKDFELIIIDDCSKDKTLEILDKKGYKYHKHTTNQGFTKTVNEGLKMAKGEYIVLADHDLILEKDYLAKLLEVNRDIVSSRLYYYKQKDKIRALNIKINLLTGKTAVLGRDEIDKGQFSNLGKLDSMGAACLLVKKTVYDKIGLFDEGFLHFYVDTDFCFRAKKAGYEIFSSQAKSWHKKEEHEVFSKKLLDKYYHDKKLFLKKHSPYYPISLIPTAAKHLLQSRTIGQQAI